MVLDLFDIFSFYQMKKRKVFVIITSFSYRMYVDLHGKIQGLGLKLQQLQTIAILYTLT